MVTRPGRRSALAVVVASAVMVGLITLRPSNSFFVTPTFCLVCGPLGGVDFALNIALFVPIGLGLRWLTRSWKTTTIIGGAMTLAIESLQWRLIPGRDASLGDLLANGAGTMLGAWLAVELVRWLNATDAVARRLAGAFATITAAVIVGSGLLLLPVPARSVQYVQWTPVRPNMDPFKGRLLTVELNGRTIHAGDALPAPLILDSSHRSLSIRAILHPAIPPSRRQSIIVRTANELEEGFFLAQRGENAVFRSDVTATRLKLRPILLSAEGGFAVSNESDGGKAAWLTVVAHSNRRSMVMSTNEGGTVISAVMLPRTAGLGWALLLPWDVALTPSWWPANALWIGVLLLPLTFFVIRSYRADVEAHRRVAWWPMALVLGSLTIAPFALGLSALRWEEWAGVVAGVLAARSLERWTAVRAATLPDSPAA